jgi:glycosyltransferase involved in cell wall biosynthesis
MPEPSAKPASNPLTILHTEASDAWGGQKIRILSEALWMREQGHRIILVTPGEGQLFKNAQEAGLEVESLALAKKTQLGDFFAMRRLLRRYQPQVVATHSSVDSWVGLLAARSCRIRTVRFRHVSTGVGAHSLNRIQYGKLADAVVTTGNCIGQQLIDELGVPAERVHTIATGVRVPAELAEREDARRILATELRLPETARFIGQVSVLRSWKGHAFLIEAFRMLAAEFPGHHLVLVGDGPIRGTIEALIAYSGLASRIHLTGHRSDPWPAFRAFDVATLASTKNEGIPQSGIQAMFAGTPFVGTNVGGIPEIIDDGTSGLLVPGSDAAELAGAIRRFLQDSNFAASCAEQARQKALANHTLDAMGTKMVALYASLLSL